MNVIFVLETCLIAVEYSGDLNTGLVWYLNGRLVSDCQMVCHWDQHLKNGFTKYFIFNGTISMYANLVNFEVYLKVPVS